MRIDLTATQTSTAAGVQAVITNIASPGDEIHLAAGTFSWTAAVTNANKNISIFGADATNPSATTINGGQMFNLTAQLDSNLLRLSAMRLNSTSDIQQLTMGGISVVDAVTFTGGFRLDHVIFSGDHPGKTIIFNGWIEGVMDHCIMEYTSTFSQGETIIVNHSTSPAGAGAYGDFSQFDPISAGNTVHAMFFEDNIFKRCNGGLDTNDSLPTTGGGRIVSRHNTAWGQIGGGHGTRESGGVRIHGQRLADVSKNLCLKATTDAEQDKNYFSARSGEQIYWGNRIKRYGNNNTGQVNSPLQGQNYLVSSQRGGDSWGGPDGRNPWDLNQKGAFTINEPGVVNNGRSYSPVAGYSSGTVLNGIDGGNNNLAGDVYLQGRGGTRTGNIVTLTKDDGTPIDYSPFGTNGHWNDFVILNLAINPDSATPVPFVYITGTTSSGLTVYTNNTYGGSNISGAQMTLAAWTSGGGGDHWEIRRVRRYFGAIGNGSMDTLVNSSTTGVKGARLTGSTTPNPHWTNITRPGISQWDNKWKNSQAGSFAPIQTWFVDTTWIHSAGGELGTNNIRDEIPHPGYPYNAATLAGSAGSPEVRPETRVGADAEAWAIAPPSITSLRSGTDMYDSLYTAGSGGYTYPHPLIAGGGTTPFISGADSATISTSSTGVQAIASFTSSNISGTVSWGLFAGSWPANVALDSSTGVLATTSSWPSGNVAGDTTVTIRATSGIVHADKSFVLTITSPNTPPTGVSITSPLNGATFTAPAAVTLKSTATDSDGSIISMEYFKTINSVTTSITVIDATTVAAPYTYLWQAVAAGTYLLTVKATDNQTGATTSTGTVSITVAPSPTLPPPTIVVSG